MHKVLVTDSLSELGLDILKESTEVIYKPGMSIEEIKKTIPECSAILVRSGTQVTKEIIDACSSRMQIIGRAGVGVDNIDVESATQKGIIVVNSPDGNTTAAAEHTISIMMSMARLIPAADASLKSGRWDRNKFIGVELRAKTLGIIGLGKIGSKVAEVAVALGMKVIVFDPLASKEKANEIHVNLVNSLDEIWINSDFISLHVPKTPQTANLINKVTISKMKDGVRIINCARGGVVNERDLAEAIISGKVAGAAIDVFETEPTSPENPLLKFGSNVIVTPHLGACTEEAQINVAVDVAKQIIKTLNGQFAENAVNLPRMKGILSNSTIQYMELAKVLGEFMEQYTLHRKPKSITLKVSGEATKEDVNALVLSSLVGFLSPKIEFVTMVNAKILAETRGLKINEVKQSYDSGYFGDIALEIDTDHRVYTIAGSVHEGSLVIKKLDQYNFFLQPTKHMLLTLHNDKPGVIAKISSLLGEKNINISGMALGRITEKAEALMICSLDDEVTAEVITGLNKITEIRKNGYIQLKF